MASKVCVYCIAKNEGPVVDRLMDSIRDADLVVVGDTGSTDDTIAKFRARGAVVHSITVEPWRFDEARNKVLDLIPPEYDCLFSIDVDETVVTTDWKKRILDTWDSGKFNRLFYYYIWALRPDGSPEKRFIYDKIHSREFKWVSPCHEILELRDPAIGQRGKLVDIEVVHRPNTKSGRGDYLGLLEMAVKERPNDFRVLHYYGRELFYHNRWVEAREVLKRHGEMEGTWAAERAASFRYAAECSIRLGQYSDADRLFARGCSVCPGEREPYVAYAVFLQNSGDHAGCFRNAMTALAIPWRKHHYLEDRYAWTEGPFDLAGVSAFYMGLKEDAKMLCRKAFDLMPGDERIKNNVSLVGGSFSEGIQKSPEEAKESAGTLETLAIEEWEKGHFETAYELHKRARTLEPGTQWIKDNDLWFPDIQFLPTADEVKEKMGRSGSYRNATISVLLAGFGRPEGALRAAVTARVTATRPELVEVLAATDETDPESGRYLKMPELDAEVVKEYATTAKWNRLASRCKGDIIILACDDVIFESAGWDEVLRSVWPDDGIAVMFSDTRSGQKFCEFPVISRKMMQALSYAAYPKLTHGGADNWWTDIGTKLGRLYYLGAVWRFRHAHYETSAVHDRSKRRSDPEHQFKTNAYTKDAAIRAEDIERLRGLMVPGGIQSSI